MRAGWGALLVVAVLAAACGDDSDGSRSATASPTAPGPVTSAATDGQAAASPHTGRDTARVPGRGGSPQTTAPSGGSAATTTTRVRRPPSRLEPSGPPGSFADELLGARTGRQLVVEVLQQQGAAPRQRSLDHLVEVLGSVSGKEIVLGAPIAVPGGTRSWTRESLVAVTTEHSRTSQGGGTVVLRLLFLHGTFAEDEGVLGVSFRGDAAAVFSDKVNEAATLGIGASQVERAVVTHEAGHLMGLVDLFLDTGRDDPEHPGHSTNPGSVMYWAVESDVVGQVLTGGPPDQFDDQDRADLARIRSTA